MPIYEYQCTACGHQLEALQKVSEPPLRECPECHKDTLGKLVSATSFQLKGTGWYETDFKTKPKSESKTETTKDAKSASSNTEVKSETTASTKTEATSNKGATSE